MIMERRILVDAEEMRKFDNYTIEKIGIPSMVLMERAALAIVDSIKKNVPDLRFKRILSVCGSGNNGGDGIAVSRLLIDMGCDVDTVLLAAEDKCSEQTQHQLTILKEYFALQTDNEDNKLYINEKDIFPILKAKEYDIIIDGIFGVGLSRNIEGEYYKCIKDINEYGAFVVSVDVPSGIDSSNGKCMGCAVRANLTVTFAYAKRGLYLYPGKEYAGVTDCRDIGITFRSFDGSRPECFTFSPSDNLDAKEEIRELQNMLPARLSYGNKGTFGKLLVIAGSKDMCGACILCGESAYRVGAGMVKIITVEENRNIIQTRFPEAMLLTYNDDVPMQKLVESIKWADGIVIGPGIGQSNNAALILETVLERAEDLVVLDADALNILASHEKLQNLIKERKEKYHDSVTVITPHQGELARLTGKDISTLKENPIEYAKDLAVSLNCVVVNKDAVTVVCDCNAKIYINSTGNSGMATAGSGDVLAGIMGGILIQKQERCNSILELVAKGVYLHGYAGDLAKKRVGEHAMVAGDLIESLKEISKEG